MFGLFKRLDRIIELLESITFQRIQKKVEFDGKIKKDLLIPKKKKKKNYKQRPELKAWRGKPHTRATDELASKLLEIRKKMGFSQEKMARQIGKGIGQSQVSMFETMKEMNALDYVIIYDFIEHVDDDIATRRLNTQ